MTHNTYALADHWLDINSLILSYAAHLVLRPPHVPLSLSCSLIVLLSFRAWILRGRRKCFYLTQIIGTSILTESIPETTPWSGNGNKPLAETSDKSRTISHRMCANMHLCACTGFTAVVYAGRYACRRVMKYRRSYRANSSVGPLTRLSASLW